MMNRSNIESRELRAGCLPTTDDGEGWQDWPADDSDLAPMVFAPIRQRPQLRTVRLSIVATSVDASDRRASTEEIIVNAAFDENAARDPAAALQRLALTAAAAALMALATVMNAGAHEAPDGGPTQGHVTEAPIGHRQPREWQLPRKVQRDEGQRTERQVEFDKELKICRGC